MGDFVFSRYVLALKNSWKGRIANEKLISLLYSAVAVPAELDGKGGYTIECSKSTASDIMKRKANAHQDIQKHSQDEVVVKGIAAFFTTSIIPKLQPTKIPELLSTLVDLLEASDLHPERVAELIGMKEVGESASFLAFTYLESLLPDNRLTASTKDQDSSSAEKSEGSDLDLASRLPSVPIPEQYALEERPYVYALLSAYGEHEGIGEFSYELLDSYPKYKKHYERQRRDYYAAETVNRGTRDVATEGEQTQFEILEDEIYEGVIDVYEDDFEDGLQRLRSVLSQASKVAVARCWVSRKTAWIGNAEKKGVCHFLVNEERLEGWVANEE